MKFKIIGIFAMLCVFLCCASPGTQQAKIYQGQLETMVGKKSYDVTPAIRDWKFEMMFSWEEENPTTDVVKTHNRPIVEFSEDEMEQIFSEGGKYRVLYFQKKEETTDASIGTITEGGMSYMTDTGMASDRYTLVRMVFKDDIFTHFKVWGNVHHTSVSGLRRIR